jgi:hypothetical protein
MNGSEWVSWQNSKTGRGSHDSVPCSVTTNNAAIPSDWKRAIVVPIYKGRGPSVVTTTVQSA